MPADNDEISENDSTGNDSTSQEFPDEESSDDSINDTPENQLPTDTSGNHSDNCLEPDFQYQASGATPITGSCLESVSQNSLPPTCIVDLKPIGDWKDMITGTIKLPHRNCESANLSDFSLQSPPVIYGGYPLGVPPAQIRLALPLGCSEFLLITAIIDDIWWDEPVTSCKIFPLASIPTGVEVAIQHDGATEIVQVAQAEFTIVGSRIDYLTEDSVHTLYIKFSLTTALGTIEGQFKWEEWIYPEG